MIAGMRVAELDARLVEAQIEMLAGRKDLAGAISKQIRDSASASGLLRLMRQATSVFDDSQRASE